MPQHLKCYRMAHSKSPGQLVSEHHEDAIATNNLRELRMLQKDLNHCLAGVELLQNVQSAEADADEFVQLTKSIGHDVTQATKDYSRALRKHVAMEAYKLSYLLHQLRKFETEKQFAARRHSHLHSALKYYHELHLNRRS